MHVRCIYFIQPNDENIMFQFSLSMSILCFILA